MHPRAFPLAKKTRSHNTLAGFTLIELAVVVLIIGLLLGGVLIGRDAIRQAQLRQMVTQTEGFASAIRQFKDKYQDLPGDMWNATAVWGTDPGGCPGAQNSVQKIETCNGNGNGRIFDFPGGGDLPEVFRAFQQLSNAGMLRGAFTGVRSAAAPADHATINLNVPECEAGGAGVWVHYYGYSDNSDGTYFPMRGHYVSCGMLNGSNQVIGGTLSSNEARGLDTKIDDSRPGTGRLVTIKNGCVTGNDPTTAEYVNSDTPYVCLPLVGIDDLR